MLQAKEDISHALNGVLRVALASSSEICISEHCMANAKMFAECLLSGCQGAIYRSSNGCLLTALFKCMFPVWCIARCLLLLPLTTAHWHTSFKLAFGSPLVKEFYPNPNYN